MINSNSASYISHIFEGQLKQKLRTVPLFVTVQTFCTFQIETVQGFGHFLKLHINTTQVMILHPAVLWLVLVIDQVLPSHLGYHMDHPRSLCGLFCVNNIKE